MAATVLLFGRLAEVAGWRTRTVDPVPTHLSVLRALIADLDPALAEVLAQPGVQAAVDQAIVRGDVALTDGTEVAFMPAMSGG